MSAKRPLPWPCFVCFPSQGRASDHVGLVRLSFAALCIGSKSMHQRMGVVAFAQAVCHAHRIKHIYVPHDIVVARFRCDQRMGAYFDYTCAMETVGFIIHQRLESRDVLSPSTSLAGVLI